MAIFSRHRGSDTLECLFFFRHYPTNGPAFLETKLKSSEGGQHGAPLSPLYFSLAIHEALRSCPKTLAHFWYLDDGINNNALIGDLTSLKKCMRHLVPRLAAVGSVVDIQKTWAPDLRSLGS